MEFVIDQNEKLVMFGVTHVCAVNGFSGKVVGFVTMPVKNITLRSAPVCTSECDTCTCTLFQKFSRFNFYLAFVIVA